MIELLITVYLVGSIVAAIMVHKFMGVYGGVKDWGDKFTTYVVSPVLSWMAVAVVLIIILGDGYER